MHVRKRIRVPLALALLAIFSMLAAPPAAAQDARKPNIVIIWGDDIGQTNLSAYSNGLMGYRTPNIDRIAREGMKFTDYYGEQSCTAGRAAFITGQQGIRTGLTKVGLPGADLGCKRKTRPLRICSSRRVTPRASSVRTTWATGMRSADHPRLR